MPRLVRFLFATASLVVALSPALAEEPSAEQKVDLKKLSVDELVERLAAPFPAPKLVGGGWNPEDWRTVNEHPHRLENSSWIVHPNVAAATEELIARGRDAVPALLKHMEDERYSFTATFASTVNMNVGDRVEQIIEDILHPELLIDWPIDGMRGFKEQPYFGQYLHRAGGVERYLEWSRTVTEREREFDYLRWYKREIDAMRSGKFWSQERQMLDEHLAPYRTRLAELEAEGVARKSPFEENPNEDR